MTIFTSGGSGRIWWPCRPWYWELPHSPSISWATGSTMRSTPAPGLVARSDGASRHQEPDLIGVQRCECGYHAERHGGSVWTGDAFANTGLWSPTGGVDGGAVYRHRPWDGPAAGVGAVLLRGGHATWGGAGLG